MIYLLDYFLLLENVLKYVNFLYFFQAIEEFKKGKVEYRADKTGIVHLPFGKANFSEEDLIINFIAAVVSFNVSFYFLYFCSRIV